ncbi:MAG: 2-hydroxychromene-2-carboxylate isomerase [Lysobacterales bacterium]|jgi:2-hydroxychromene-2-carboxylate isomerase
MNATWYFDFVSPFAYLQLPTMLALRERLAIVPGPIVFGAVLAHHGQLGPAEIPAKRAFTYRFVQWQAERTGIRLRFPPAHPFNPLAALRLCLAAGAGWEAVQAIFEHIWRDGNSGSNALELAAVGAALGIDDVAAAIASSAIKDTLRANTAAAIADGVFGVPTVRVADALFWGNDASPMLDAFLDDRAWFDSAEQQRLAQLPVGMDRAR